MPDFARIYATFRGSKAFLVGLVTFVFTWITLHFVFGIDPEFGMLNLFLSSEASISLAFFTMLSDRQDQHANAQGEALAKMLAALLTIAESQRDMLRDHAEVLRALREGDERLLKVLTKEES
jgi:uncharacterized membrane protein